MARLNDQIAVVTGASGGIGGAISEALAREGASVNLVGRDRARLEARADALRREGLRSDAFRVDLTVDSDVDALAAHLADPPDRLDILVHCAGTMEHGPLADAPIDALDRHYAANVRGPLLLTQRLLPLLQRPRGQIVFVNSSVALAARRNAGHYSAMQHAVKALADCLRDEVNALGIRVVSLFPGRTATPRMAALYAREGTPYRPELLLQPGDVASAVVHALTLPWTAEVTDVRIRPMVKSY
jgi:NADP-dependent 3-hydroxy acid dehydrogenase YdfG